MQRLTLLALLLLTCGCGIAPHPAGAAADLSVGAGRGNGIALDATAPARPDTGMQLTIRLPRSGSREVRSDWPDAVDPGSAPSFFSGIVLQFEQELAHSERLRTERELLPPLFVPASLDLQSPGLQLHSEEQHALEELERTAAEGFGALGRPMQGAVRNSDVGLDLQQMLADARRGSRSTRAVESLDADVDLGTPGIRLRMDRIEDPLELTWRLGGLRAGASLETARLGIEQPLRRDLSLVASVRARHEEGELAWRTGIQWRLGKRTRLDAMGGTGLDFLPATGMHARYESPLDESRGVLLQLVHRF